MARGREQAPPTQWVIDSDETCLTLYVSVTKTMGTVGSAMLTRHHLRDDSVQTRPASYRGDDTDQSFPAVLRAMRALLDAAEKSWKLEQERHSYSNT